MKFTHILGECDSKEWASPKLQSECGKSYWIVIRILNLLELTGDKMFCAMVSICIPELASERAKEFARKDWSDETQQMGAIWEYGARADVWETTGEHPMSLMLEAVKEATNVPEYFEDYMSSPVNRMGWTGWKMVSF